MPLAIGRHLALRLSQGGWVAILTVAAVLFLLIYWSRIVGWIERRWRSR
jgi:hypothetical protein